MYLICTPVAICVEYHPRAPILAPQSVSGGPIVTPNSHKSAVSQGTTPPRDMHTLDQ